MITRLLRTLSLLTCLLTSIFCFSQSEINKDLLEESVNYPSLVLQERQLGDLEMLLVGAFDPLEGFLNKNDYESVVEHCRLSNGKLWPMPIVLSVREKDLHKFENHNHITLKDSQNNPLAILDIEDIYKPDITYECLKVFGTTDTNHPFVNILMNRLDTYNIGGRLRQIQLPKHYDFKDFRLSPKEVKKKLQEKQWQSVIGFQTRNPLHKSHIALTLNCAETAEANILLQPVVGITQTQDIDYATRVRCYKKLLEHYPKDKVMLSLIPLSMRMGGPREALWHALIRKNYGCTHFIIGRDHAGPSSLTKNGEKFYGPYEAQEFVNKFKDELGIDIVTSKEIVYVEELDKHLPIDEVPDSMTILKISGTEFRKRLLNNDPIPEWFSFPEIIEELKSSYCKNEGFCVYFTGLSGSGKSTLANALKSRLQSLDPLKRKITVLDGDVVRNNLSKGLGFSKEDRSINVQRIGFVASLVVKNGGICLCANIAPYESDRRINERLISKYGPYIEIFVDTPIELCEQRDAKGLYKLAREGKIKEFTGVSDPFEPPAHAVILDGSKPVDELLDQLIALLRKHTTLDID